MLKLSCCLSRGHIVGQVLRSQDKRTASEQKTCKSRCIRRLPFTDEAQRGERRLCWILPVSSWSSHCTCQRCKDAVKCLHFPGKCSQRSKDHHLQMAVLRDVLGEGRGCIKSVQQFGTSPAYVSGTHRTPAFAPPQLPTFKSIIQQF